MPDAQRCPLCGSDNQCGQADPARRDQPCWCFAARIEPAALERLTPGQRNRACLCRACAGAIAPAPGSDDA